MINRKELNDFVAFCQTKFKIEIEESIVNEYVEYLNSISPQGLKNSYFKDSENTMCGTQGIACSHVALNTAKCKECLN